MGKKPKLKPNNKGVVVTHKPSNRNKGIVVRHKARSSEETHSSYPKHYMSSGDFPGW